MHLRHVLVVLTLAAIGALWACTALISEHTSQQQLAEASDRIAALERSLEVAGPDPKTHALRGRVSELESEIERLRASVASLRSPPGRVAELESEIARLRDSVSNLSQPVRQDHVQRPSQPQSGSPALPSASPSPSPAPTELPTAPPTALPTIPAGGRLTEETIKALAARDAIGVVVITCQRRQYLQRAMESFLKVQRDPQRFPIVLSQDGPDEAMAELIETNYVSKGLAAHIRHTHEPGAMDLAMKYNAKRPKMALGYVRIAQHYGWAMKKMYDEFGFQQVIYLEEDMEIAPDFFSYFEHTLPLIRQDPKLFCVSAWNDNGYNTLVADVKAVFRTDYFPGLGWLMTKSMWDEVRDHWALAYWDEFMRRPDVRKGRHCIRPEVSRSATFGEQGVSAGQFFKQHLSRIRLNSEPLDWSTVDLAPLASEEAFDKYFSEQLGQAKKISLAEVQGNDNSGASLRIVYDDKREYAQVAKKFELMPDEKEGIRRMSYKGVIPFSWKGNRMFLHTAKWPGQLS